MRTVCTEPELDALAEGTRLRFVGSGVGLEKTLGGLFRVEGYKGVYLPEDIVRNRNPMEVLGEDFNGEV